MSEASLTKDFLKEHFEYKNGELYWKLFSIEKGWHLKKAGFITNDGVYKVKINKKFYCIHRIIFKMFNGYAPKHLTHKNKNKLDNRIENICVSKKPKKVSVTRESFIYRWESLDGRFYIGKHKGYANDGYICGNFYLKKEIKNNPQNWHRSILLIVDNEVDAYKIETMLIRTNKSNSFCLNGKLV